MHSVLVEWKTRVPFSSLKGPGLMGKLHGHPLDDHFLYSFAHSLSFSLHEETRWSATILSSGGTHSSPHRQGSPCAQHSCLQMAPRHLHLNFRSPLLPHPVPSPLLPPKWTLCLPRLLLPLFSFMPPPTLGTTYWSTKFLSSNHFLKVTSVGEAHLGAPIRPPGLFMDQICQTNLSEAQMWNVFAITLRFSPYSLTSKTMQLLTNFTISK